jgi:UDP-glucose 4-epimerase
MAFIASQGNKVSSTVLITGGCGFIGTWVVREALRRSLNVVVLDPGTPPARWDRVLGKDVDSVVLEQGSLLDRDRLDQIFATHDITHVIHLAALLTPACQSDPWEGCQVNILGTMAMLEAIRKHSGRIAGFSYASSVAVFGDEPDHALGETGGLLQPLTFYGAFKTSVELIAAQYWRHFNIASLGIRPQVAYGPERDVGLTAGPSMAARALAHGEPFTIGYRGRVGYDYVEDVATAFVRGALETPQGAPVVDLAGPIATVEEVVEVLRELDPKAGAGISVSGGTIPSHAPPRPRFISELYPDWQTTSLLDGMRKTLEFYRGAITR